MSDTLKARLLELLEGQAEFGALPLPAGVDPALFRDPARLRKALESRGAGAPAAPASTSQPSPWSGGSLRPTAPAAAPPVKAPPAKAPLNAPPVRPLELRWSSLDELRAAVCACKLCGLAGRRTQTVFGVGRTNADLVLVGEAPGEQEDLRGEPFVGPAGELLDKMLAAIGFARQDLFICNTLKCRPPGNRNPGVDELVACRPFLDHQLHFLKPKLILALGKVAANTLLGRESSLGSMRGEEFSYQGVPLRVTYHPAALLRNIHWKRPAWEDLQALRKRYDELGGAPGSLPQAGKAS
ncbi:MAG: uracil-DNA glycosylase [Candidatus Delongbacteria bacterium]